MNASFLAGILATLAVQWVARMARRVQRPVVRHRKPAPTDAPAPPSRLYPSLKDPANWPKRRRKAR